MAFADEHEPVQEPELSRGLSIQAASDQLKIPAPTIRSWQRRYGVPPSGRSQGGHRRFFGPDLAQLQQMRDEIARGRRAADAAAIVRAAASAVSPHQPRIDEFLQAARNLNPQGAVAVLNAARDQQGVDQAVCGVLLPAMRQIGVWWAMGRCDVAHEHLASEAVRAWLNRQLYLGPAPWQSQSLLLTCGPRDFHTLGLESMAVLLAHRGWGCRVLGAHTPANALATAIRGTGAAGVILVSHLSVGRRSAVDALRVAQSTDAKLFYAGNAFLAPISRVAVPGTYLGENLVEAADLIGRELTP